MSVENTRNLPESDAYVKIHAFSSAPMKAPARVVIDGHRGTLVADSWRHLIVHEPSNTKLWFDLGISDDLTNYPPHIRENQIKLFNAEPAKTTILADAESVGIDPNEVNTLVISHAHWDHSFPVGSYFPNAKVLCGPGTLELTAESWPDSPDSHYDSRIWNPAKSELPIEELPDPKTASDKWRPIGPFPRGYDYFGDGSFWLIDAPGHVDGNLAALVRTQNRDRERRWIVLGGDCLHCYHLVHHPEAPFGKGLPINTSGTLHADVDEARNTIRKISSMKKAYGDQLFVWPAHDNLLEGLWEFDV